VINELGFCRPDRTEALLYRTLCDIFKVNSRAIRCGLPLSIVGPHKYVKPFSGPRPSSDLQRGTAYNTDLRVHIIAVIAALSTSSLESCGSGGKRAFYPQFGGSAVRCGSLKRYASLSLVLGEPTRRQFKPLTKMYPRSPGINFSWCLLWDVCSHTVSDSRHASNRITAENTWRHRLVCGLRSAAETATHPRRFKMTSTVQARGLSSKSSASIYHLETGLAEEELVHRNVIFSVAIAHATCLGCKVYRHSQVRFQGGVIL